ncbi:hypothetical protein [Planctomicrobium sp. SH664]|uniref:hypothetical protein n=1 Tax=Planctomicrobium sp. SH664 TaxID=3448125 RepID=UPI003F5BF4B9
MVKMIKLAVFGIAIGALAAGGSLVLQKKLSSSPVATATAAAPASEHVTAAAEPTAPKGVAQSTSADHHALKASATDTLPVPVRPRGMSVEELLRYGMSVKEREQHVRQQEEQLQQRRIQQQLVLADIEGERREIDGLRIQVNDHLKSAERLIERLNAARQSVIDERTAANAEFSKMKEARIEVDGQQADNTKRLAQWLQGMDAEKSASVLKEMANDGKMEMAVQILSHFEAREAAKILSAIEDPKLIQQFAEKYQNVKSASRESTKR